MSHLPQHSLQNHVIRKLSEVFCCYLQRSFTGWLWRRTFNTVSRSCLWFWWSSIWKVCCGSRRNKQNKVRTRWENFKFYCPKRKWVKYLTCCGSCGSWQGVQQLEQPSGRAPLPGRWHRLCGPADGRSHPDGWDWYLGHQASKEHRYGNLLWGFYKTDNWIIQ